MPAHLAAAAGDYGAPMRADDDAALVRAARDGSRSAAAELFTRHWPSARRAALAITGSHASADDVAQDAFVRAFARIDAFDTARPFAPWLHRIVVNRALDHLRAERRVVPLDVVARELAAPPPPEAPDAALAAALARLSPERRVVVVLRHLLDHTPPEIAGILGVPVGTVNSRLGRALADLRRLLEEDR